MTSYQDAIETVWAKLPFINIHQFEDGIADVRLWEPSNINDYFSSCDLGRSYLYSTLEYVQNSGDIALLPRIIGAMPRSEEFGGIEIGFLTALATAAVGGPITCNLLG